MRGVRLIRELEGRPIIPEIEELKLLYRDFVCDTITDEALDLFDRQELVRHIAKQLYMYLRREDRSPGESVNRVARILHITKRTVRNYRNEIASA